MSNTLFLRLEGPLQSWGERGRWSIRDSAPEPTKSGVVGLLACALGVGDDASISALSEGLRMGVRVDRPGTVLTDYHTVGGGYAAPALLTAQGKPKISSGRPHTEISLRDYLADASFLVALQGDPALVADLAAAVANPVWVIFLGRKSCPPSQPVLAGLGDYPDLEAALIDHEWPDNEPDLRAVIECAPDAPSAMERRDHLASRRYRVHEPRYTRTVRLAAAGATEAAP